MGQHNKDKDGNRTRDPKHAAPGRHKDTGHVGKHRDENDNPTNGSDK